MIEPAEATTVRGVVRAVVTERASHELPLLEALWPLDDERAVRILAGQGVRREPLGFGLAEATGLVTAVVWLVLDQAARRAIDTAADSAIERSRSGLRRLLRRAPAEPPRLVPEWDRTELATVRAQIVERAAERGIDGAEAQALADAVVAHLATAEPESPEPSDRAGGTTSTAAGDGT
ncbi:hypothetical protein ACIGPN_01740 [Streptomyces afghaniensis]|uniref:hypothetical protein n=1 Tax=Streptomyces TaxID=1883 RepID=UPI0009EAB01E|nr:MULTISPECIES: hypothetical protein [Streptomyces]UOB14736.1 hypothetical protein MQE23_39245 [Streptomyces sp. HP-A2021]